MEVITSVERMKEVVDAIRAQGKRICLVPTMGALHEGHLSLVRMGKQHSDVCIVSIFVNPIQFGPSEDFATYPRDLNGDKEKLQQLNVDFVFAPDAGDMYNRDFQTRVELQRLPNHLCGLFRPGHFAGVATVVLKLFNICKPHVAVFGMKDYQQLRVIEQMVSDLNLDVRILRHPTVREPDGLAMSSRNSYLSPEERVTATKIYKTLKEVEERIKAGDTDAVSLETYGRRQLESSGFSVDYFSIVDPETLDSVSEVAGSVVVAVAARLGKTRLIDNIIVTP
jgi:pantoate--beta-alanine ligase